MKDLLEQAFGQFAFSKLCKNPKATTRQSISAPQPQIRSTSALDRAKAHLSGNAIRVNARALNTSPLQTAHEKVLTQDDTDDLELQRFLKKLETNSSHPLIAPSNPSQCEPPISQKRYLKDFSDTAPNPQTAKSKSNQFNIPKDANIELPNPAYTAMKIPLTKSADTTSSSSAGSDFDSFLAAGTNDHHMMAQESILPKQHEKEKSKITAVDVSMASAALSLHIREEHTREEKIPPLSSKNLLDETQSEIFDSVYLPDNAMTELGENEILAIDDSILSSILSHSVERAIDLSEMERASDNNSIEEIFGEGDIPEAYSKNIESTDSIELDSLEHSMEENLTTDQLNGNTAGLSLQINLSLKQQLAAHALSQQYAYHSKSLSENREASLPISTGKYSTQNSATHHSALQLKALINTNTTCTNCNERKAKDERNAERHQKKKYNLTRSFIDESYVDLSKDSNIADYTTQASFGSNEPSGADLSCRDSVIDIDACTPITGALIITYQGNNLLDPNNTMINELLLGQVRLVEQFVAMSQRILSSEKEAIVRRRYRYTTLADTKKVSVHAYDVYSTLKGIKGQSSRLSRR